MAVDKPGDYVGNHGGAYTDIDGLSKQFTYVDHDKKLTAAFNSNTPFNIEWNAMEAELVGTPIFDKYLKDNSLEWGLNVNLGHLRQIKQLYDELQRTTNKKDN